MQRNNYKDNFKRRKKFNVDSSDLDYKNVSLLNQFTDSANKIVGRKQTGFDAKKQRLLKKAVKRARTLGLMK